MFPGCSIEDAEQYDPPLGRFFCGELLAHDGFAVAEPFFVRENFLVSAAMRFERGDLTDDRSLLNLVRGRAHRVRGHEFVKVTFCVTDSPANS